MSLRCCSDSYSTFQVWQACDLEHVTLYCPTFAAARSRCADALSLLYVPIPLELDLILGSPPPLPPRFSDEKAFHLLIHKQCLDITGKFLLNISNSQFL